MNRIAVDIDLNNFTAVDDKGKVWAHKKPWGEIRNVTGGLLYADLVLVEIAGPVMHHAESHSHRRWMIFNVAAAIELAHIVGYERTRVCTSTEWTKGYSEEQRHALAGILPTKRGKRPSYKDPHDVRECQCMLYFHQHAPAKWLTVPEFMETLAPTPPPTH